jgi:hypothetical protein
MDRAMTWDFLILSLTFGADCKLTRMFRSILPLILLTIFYSCNNDTAPEKDAGPQPADVPMAFSFISTLPPYEEDLSTAIIKTFNTASMNEARKAHSDSALVMTNGDSAPVYSDISFFPVMDKDTLAKVYSGSFNKKKNQDSAAVIDFSRYFTFVVTHPPAGNIDYYNTLSELRAPGDTLYLSMTSSPMNTDENSPLANYWSTTVYKLEKGGYKVLAVAFRRDSTFYRLNE